MRLANEFIRLPLTFDIERLSEEVLAFQRSEWLPHVQGFAGNSAIPLISHLGEMNDDFNGPMEVTEKLQQCAYIKQAIGAFGEVFGRSRLMGLNGGCSVPMHRDVNYHWYKRVRIHIPILTNPKVIFHCGETHVHMKAGEAWIFDSWQQHRVENNSDKFRVHLVIDTIGSPNFWKMVSGAEWRCDQRLKKPATISDQFISYEEGSTPDILTEKYNAPLVMHPGEIDALIMDILADVNACKINHPSLLQAFNHCLQDFRLEWHRLWSLYGQSSQGWGQYQQLIRATDLPKEILYLASNQGSANHTFGARILSAALNVDLAYQYGESL